MFNNCYTFNGPESAVSLIGRPAHEWFDNEVQKTMPKTMRDVLAKGSKGVISGKGRTSDANVPTLVDFRELLLAARTERIEDTLLVVLHESRKRR
jgi:hypothetical protein